MIPAQGMKKDLFRHFSSVMPNLYKINSHPSTYKIHSQCPGPINHTIVGSGSMALSRCAPAAVGSQPATPKVAALNASPDIDDLASETGPTHNARTNLIHPSSSNPHA